MQVNNIPTHLETWQMVQATQIFQDPKDKVEGSLERKSLPIPEIKQGEVLIEISGCGVCGSDIGYFYEGIPTLIAPPITLGHEISGVVIAGDKNWIGTEVIVPTIIPCGECDLCKSGRANRCLFQKMPGNNLSIYGGFSSHIVVPSRDLCQVPHRGNYSLAQLTVIADAMGTPYQAAKRANLGPGDRVIIIGVTGGCGVYMAQWSKLMGAEVVIGIGRNQEKLERALDYGCDFVINSKEKSSWDVQKEFSRYCRKNQVNARSSWKIFEVSGTKTGQELALNLLRYTGILVVVGYSPENISYNISRLSAFDAEIIGTWGCLPEYYPVILEEALSGNIQVAPFVEEKPMSHIQETFTAFYYEGSPMKRVVLVPDF